MYPHKVPCSEKTDFRCYKTITVYLPVELEEPELNALLEGSHIFVESEQVKGLNLNMSNREVTPSGLFMEISPHDIKLDLNNVCTACETSQAHCSEAMPITKA